MMARPACAQERVIKMPTEQASRSLNIAEVQHGFWCALEGGGGYTLMEGRRNVGLVETSFIGGYRFSEFLKAGIGIGALWYPNNNTVRDRDTHLAMPVFLNFRGNILTEQIRMVVPYWSANIGTALADGFFFTPQVGLRLGESRSAFTLSIGYTLRHLYTTPESDISNYSGAVMIIGYEF